MKKSLLTLFLVLLTAMVSAQDWLAGSHGNFVSEALDVAVDGNGNSVVTGYFSGQLNFTDSSVQAVSGLSDIFLAKFDGNGNLLWLKRFGGAQADRGHKVAFDSNNNIYLTGYFSGSFNFGGISIASAGGSRDIFTAKLTPAGAVTWVRSDGGSGEDTPFGLAVDSQGNAVITGRFSGTTNIGGVTHSSQINPNTGLPGLDIFIAKFTASGAPVWTRKAHSKLDDTGIAVTCDNANNIYVTGQYSDTMTFITQTVNNQVNNAGYVARLSANGDVQWFDKLGATQTYASAIRINANNELYLTGNFLGTMIIQANAVTSTLTNPYIKKIFLIKLTSSNGALIWSRAQGSDSDVNARGLAIDPTQNVYIGGDFRCNFDQYRDSTDTGLWNSVGFRDVFVSKFSPGGGMIWNKHSAGKKDDFCYALASGGNDKPIFAGSFENDFFVPTNTYNLTNASVSPNNIVFNGAPGALASFLFYRITGDLSKNIFVGKVNDATNPNYYFYLPGGMGGGAPYNYIEPELYPQQDTIEFCNATYLSFQQHADPVTGPEYAFAWSDDNLDPNPFLYIAHTTEWVVVTSPSIDGCTLFSDSIFTIAHISPPMPLMSDDHNYNSNTPVSYNNIRLCQPDTALVSFSNPCPGCTLDINYYNVPYFSGTDTFAVFNAGDYNVIVTDSFGCTTQSVFAVISDSIIDYDSIFPVILLVNADNLDDSISVCENEVLHFMVIDTITNPQGNYTIYSAPFITEFFFSPDAFMNMNLGPHACTMIADTTGWYTVTYTADIGYSNACGTDTIHYMVTDSFYVYVSPNPVANISLTSDSPVCPGDSAYISVSQPMPGGIWTGNNIVWESFDGDSILVSQPGYYAYAGTAVDTVSGCSNNYTTGLFVSNKVAPLIQMYPFDGLICPNATVTLSVTPPGTYSWIAPDGTILGNAASLEVSSPGLYSCVYTDPEGCSFALEQVEITEYITPFLAYSPVNVFCDEEDIELIPVYNGSAAITWLAPINSFENTVTVHEPGTYYVEIYQCNTTILDSVTIYQDNFTPFLNASDSMICPGDSVLLTANTGMISYEWNDGEFLNNTYWVSVPGTYEVTMISGLGCEKSASIEIGEHVVPPVPDVADTAVCQGADVVLTDYSGIPADWYENPSDQQPFASGSTCTISNIPGSTTLYVTHPHPGCPYLFDTVTISVTDTLIPPDIYGDAVLCEGEALNLSTDIQPGFTTVWTYGNDTLSAGFELSVPYTTFPQNGNIVLTITNSCSEASSVAPVTLVPEYSLQLNVQSVKTCDFNTVQLYPVPAFNGEVFWYTGLDTISGNPVTIAAADILDSVVLVTGIDLNGCITLPVPVFLYFEDCSPKAPNIITSDGDGINDYFIIPNAELMEGNYLIILNRWGNVIYETENYQNTFSGPEFSEGVYFYIFYPDGKNGIRQRLEGFFHLYH